MPAKVIPVPPCQAASGSQTSPLAVRPGTAAMLLDCGVTKVYELIKRGELRTIPFESDKRIPIEEVRRLAIEGTGAR